MKVYLIPLIQPLGSSPRRYEMADICKDLVNELVFSNWEESNCSKHINEDLSKHDKLLCNLQAELWPIYTKMPVLNFIVKLMHIKVLNKRKHN